MTFEMQSYRTETANPRTLIRQEIQCDQNFLLKIVTVSGTFAQVVYL